ncbi:hypothetical protein VNI00_010945 [Paramarasmius palmivorus]|uniref:Lysine-specific metallo-endopeptidase domain-containing protein n=1 Tax=Paramarasmius palmivorus TaxID=297713 RepID=A0AAW0CF01_9AGAR
MSRVLRPASLVSRSNSFPSKLLSSKAMWIVLKPGQSIQVQHDLSAAYNFTLPGEGLYDIHADSLFQIVDPATNQLADLRASQEASFKFRHRKESNIYVLLSTQQSQLAAAATAAANYANSASSYLNSLNSSSPRYTTWFGTYLTPNKDTVTNHFTAIKGYSFSGETYDCSCTDTGVFAYVYPDEYGVIYLCGAFWSAPVTGTDSKGGTLVHESSHFTAIAGTQDKAYGSSFAMFRRAIVKLTVDTYFYRTK